MLSSFRVFRHITFLVLGLLPCFSWPLTSSTGVSVLKCAASQVLRCCTVKYTTLTRSIRRQAAVGSLWTPRAPATARVCGGASTLISARSWEDVLTRPTLFSCTKQSLCFYSIPRSGQTNPHTPNRFQLGYTGWQVYINLLATDFFFSNFSTPVFKMWVIQKPNKVALWNKRYFEEEKMEIIQHV